MEEKQPTSEEMKEEIEANALEVRCPIHNKLIGKYDKRVGLINVSFYCAKCKMSYIFTIKQKKV